MTVPYTKDWSSYSKLDPELEAMLPALSAFKMVDENTTLTSFRALANRGPPFALWPEVKETEIQIPVRDGSGNVARVYSPAVEDGEGVEGRPLLVMIYGGGYVLGVLSSEELNCRTWVKEFGGVAVAISYRLCPEHAWPGPHEDIYDAVSWVGKNHKSLGVGADAEKGFVIGGSSAGATTAITLTHLFRDESFSPKLTGLWLCVPAPCIVSVLPEKYKSKESSWQQNHDAPLFTVPVSNFLASHVALPSPTTPLRSPLLYPSHANLPPTYFAIAGADPWRDVGLIYEEILREENGAKTKVDVYQGVPDGFWGMIPKTTVAEVFRGKTKESLGCLLRGGVDE